MGAVHQLPLGRYFLIDDDGVLLRVTWHEGHGFFNLSLWREDRCVETFHLTPALTAELLAFLVDNLAHTATQARPPVRVVGDPAWHDDAVAPTALGSVASVARDWLAGRLEDAAVRLRRR